MSIKTVANNLFETLSGFSVGYTFASANSKEVVNDSQGKHYIAAAHQFAQILSVTNTIFKINQVGIKNSTLKSAIGVACNLTPILAIPGVLINALVKSGHYECAIQMFNQLTFSPIFFKSLSPEFEKSINNFSENLSRVLHIALITSSTVLIFLGHSLYGGSLIAGLAYREFNMGGWLPQNYLSTLSLIGKVVQGPLSSRLIALSEASTSLVQFIPAQMKKTFFDNLQNRVTGIIAGVFQKRDNENHIQPKQIIKANDESLVNKELFDFEINPQHFALEVRNNDFENRILAFLKNRRQTLLNNFMQNFNEQFDYYFPCFNHLNNDLRVCVKQNLSIGFITNEDNKSCHPYFLPIQNLLLKQYFQNIDEIPENCETEFADYLNTNFSSENVNIKFDFNENVVSYFIKEIKPKEVLDNSQTTVINLVTKKYLQKRFYRAVLCNLNVLSPKN